MMHMNRLKSLRLENNLLQKDLANFLNMSQNGYSQYENEITDISTLKLKKLANYYKVSIDYILGLTDINTSYKPSKIINISNNMNRLRDIREDKDLLQKDMAKILNMSQTGYSPYETGFCDIPTKILKKLALYYNVPIDYLLYLTDERKPHKRR